MKLEELKKGINYIEGSRIATLQSTRRPIKEEWLSNTFEDPFYKLLKDDSVDMAISFLKRWCNDFVSKDLMDIKGFYLFSQVGRCKTSLLSCVYNFLIKNDAYACCTTVENIWDIYINNWDTQSCVYDFFLKCNVLLIDDIGIQSLTSYSEDTRKNAILKDLLDERNKANKITCFTSNYSFQQLLQRGYMPQSVDRIREMTSQNLLYVDGSSVRGLNNLVGIQHDAREMKNPLKMCASC